MKKTIIITALILTTALTACTGSQNGSKTEKNTEATVELTTSDGLAVSHTNPGDRESVQSAAPKETPAALTGSTGKYLTSTSGDGILVIDDYGPVTFTYEAEDRTILDTLKDGDSISAKTGLIAETWPGQTTVYEITFIKEGTRNDIDPATLSQLMEMGQIEKAPLTRMFYARDTLFTDTGRIARPTCGTEDGSFTIILDDTQVPTENGQSNFGTSGNGYISIWDGAMAVRTGDTYSLFLADDTVEYEGSFFKKSDLSEDTLTWLEHHNSLPEEYRLSTSYVPHELLPPPGSDSAIETASPPDTRSYQ